MRKIFLSFTIIGLLASCNTSTENQTDDTAATSVAENTAVENSASNFFAENKGKYPQEIKLLEESPFAERIKTLAGTDYEAMVKNFNVESPIVEENGVYKTSGCLKNNCPGFSTTIYYDEKKDNLNIVTDQNGKIKDYNEKGKIEISVGLQKK